MKCYIIVDPYGSEPPLKANATTWYDRLPKAQVRKSERTVKLIRPSCLTDKECNDCEVELKEEPITAKNQMEIEYSYDTWDDSKIRQLFSPSKDEHPLDAIARQVDLFIEARTTEKGYKLVIQGGDPLENCTELEIIFLLDKCMFLLAALNNALLYYQKKNGRSAVKRPVTPANC